MLVESLLYFAERLTEHYKGPNGEGPDIYLKREDLNHTGAHKINNVVAQALLAKRLGKKRIIAETGAGQHGVATLLFVLGSDWSALSIWGLRIWRGNRLMFLECDFSALRVEAAGHGVDSGRHAPGISASPSEETMQYFNVMILGPTQSPYEGMVEWELQQLCHGMYRGMQLELSIKGLQPETQRERSSWQQKLQSVSLDVGKCFFFNSGRYSLMALAKPSPSLSLAWC
ncbi:hypothetical protein IFM89_012999 [Coptis chinensis]|uniref:Tryptophan synthase n=1 Tax=Coptis chinensis TaxID=261450 RepID=A0A835IV68_9MAGN|nr:hypothetical protein IFM89_012999 [Coptis chinensis]